MTYHKHSLVRLVFFVGLILSIAFVTPIPASEMHVPELTQESSLSTMESKARNASGIKLSNFSKQPAPLPYALSIFLLLLLIIQRLFTSRLQFAPFISRLLKSLLLSPIKFTSFFVQRNSNTFCSLIVI
ncbi:hypothetical protein J2Z66_008675 [Paenibacillus eucommiae]|uniref:Uncharacterized protein n=1 Tax=Paenibacillus eucommiae TaxID=1355755 RepID=A0ABS4JAX0_9BACL|nr:hypothetical protein [Paenibacillus eucommiae]